MIPAYKRMIEFNKNHKDAKDVYKKMQQWYLDHGKDDGVFCPSMDTYPMSNRHAKARMLTIQKMQSNGGDLKSSFDGESLRLIHEVYSLFVFGTWRNTLSIYTIDDEIFEQTVKSLIPTDTPTTIFSRLPEWCVYIEIPKNYTLHLNVDSTGNREHMRGFWVLLDYQMDYVTGDKSSQQMLSIFPDLSNTDELIPIDICVRDGLTVEQAIKEANENDPFWDGVSDNSKDDLNLALLGLSMLLWLCAEEPDITNMAGEPVSRDTMRLPKYRRNKKTGVFVPPNTPTVYRVGERLGGEVRTFNDKYGKPDARISSRKRPHIRRGHWHGVWRGTGQNKSFHIYWQPAIFVNTTLSS